MRNPIKKIQSNNIKSIIEIQNKAISFIQNTYTEKQKNAWRLRQENADKVAHKLESEPLCYGYFEDNNLIGFVWILGTDRIWHLYVHPNHQGKGVARALLKRAENKICSAGSTKAQVNSSINAVNFYGKQGYTPVQDTTLVLNGVEISVTKMEKDLG